MLDDNALLSIINSVGSQIKKKSPASIATFKVMPTSQSEVPLASSAAQSKESGKDVLVPELKPVDAEAANTDKKSVPEGTASIRSILIALIVCAIFVVAVAVAVAGVVKVTRKWKGELLAEGDLPSERKFLFSARSQRSEV